MIAGIATLLGACVGTPRPAPSPASKAADLSGTWLLITESQVGAQDARMTVQQSGSALTGTITGQAGTFDYKGTVNGANVAFNFILPVRGTELKLDYTGTVAGDTIKGKAVFGQIGEGSFTATRQ